MELETPRLRLDALHLGDAEVLFRYRADPEVARYQGWLPASADEARQFIQDQAGLPVPAPGSWVQRAIRLRDGGALVGDVGFCLSTDRQLEFGISLAPLWQGQGLAREALQTLLSHWFGAWDVHRVHASVDPRNAPSMALLRALGLRQEAHFRESLLFRGEWVDDVIFAMLVSEWRNVAPESAAEASSR
ncbi:GNAT family N-acetyltransferase [Dyella sp. 20L07]|uniref:GNAT family N-acetyltransferase n=1 Tax=Dyella sp. 20L07 TaxID=3384240 RepID=UPI003D2D2E85